jgi:hypothetical protein
MSDLSLSSDSEADSFDDDNDSDSDIVYQRATGAPGLAGETRHRGVASSSREHDEYMSIAAAMVPRLLRAQVGIVAILVVCVPMLLLKAVMFAYEPLGGWLSGQLTGGRFSAVFCGLIRCVWRTQKRCTTVCTPTSTI